MNIQLALYPFQESDISNNVLRLTAGHSYLALPMDIRIISQFHGRDELREYPESQHPRINAYPLFVYPGCFPMSVSGIHGNSVLDVDNFGCPWRYIKAGAIEQLDIPESDFKVEAVKSYMAALPAETKVLLHWF